MKNKKILAAKILKTSPKKVRFTSEGLEDVKKAITRSDMRGLIAVKKIIKAKDPGHSRAGARRLRFQKKKGRRKGKGTKKGSKYSIVSRKRQWIEKVRVQRAFLKELRNKNLLSIKNYRELYAKSKGGFFRNKRHIKLYLTEYDLIQAKVPAKREIS